MSSGHLICERMHTQVLGCAHFGLGLAELVVLVVAWSLSGLWLFKVMEFLFAAIVFGCLAITCGIACVALNLTASSSSLPAMYSTAPNQSTATKPTKTIICSSRAPHSSSISSHIVSSQPYHSIISTKTNRHYQTSPLAEELVALNHLSRHRNSIISIDNPNSAEEAAYNSSCCDASRHLPLNISNQPNTTDHNQQKRRDFFSNYSSRNNGVIPSLKSALLPNDAVKFYSSSDDPTTSNTTSTATSVVISPPAQMRVTWSDLPPTVKHYSDQDAVVDVDDETFFARRRHRPNVTSIAVVVASSLAVIISGIILARSITNDTERVRDPHKTPDWWLKLHRQQANEVLAQHPTRHRPPTVTAARTAMAMMPPAVNADEAADTVANNYYGYIYGAMDNIPLDAQYQSAAALNFCTVLLLMLVSIEIILALWTAAYVLVVRASCFEYVERWWSSSSTKNHRRRGRERKSMQIKRVLCCCCCCSAEQAGIS